MAIAGALMMYFGAEDGMEEFYRSILRMKRALPPLDRGSVDCMAVRADDPRVFTPLRVLGSQVVLPVINIADRLSTPTLTLDPAALPLTAKSCKVIDRMDGTVVASPTDNTARFLELVPAG